MPFQSDAQRRFLFAKHPKVAEEFAEHTPKNANLPEHVKQKMAEGGVPEDKDAAAKPDEKKPEGDAFTEGIKAGVNHDSDAVRSYLASKFHNLTRTNDELDKMAAAGYAEGGKVERSELEHQEPNAMMARPMADGGVWMQNEPVSTVDRVTHVEGKKPTENTATETGEAHKPKHGDKSDIEKRSAIYKAMGMDKYADGGTPSPLPVDPTDPGLGLPNSQDPTFWDQIKAALSKVAAPITKPLGAMADMTSGAAHAVTPMVQAAAPGAVSAINSLTGANLPIPAAPEPQVPESATPTPLSATVPTPPAAPKPPMLAPKAAIPTPAAPGLQGIFNQDTSKLTEGANAEDRQKIADTMGAKQTGLGSIIAQAVAGLGDAIAAKGGREQHSLQNIFTMQKQQRDEALTNFDKARQDRLEKLDLQTKMGNNTLNQLAAKDAYGVDEHLNKMLGAPTGTAHKDLPLYMQMMTAKAAQSEKDSDLYMKAHKQAADEVEASIKNAGMFNFKPGADQIKAAGAKLADMYYNRAKGSILFQPSDGQKPLWIPANNVAAAKKMDPNGRIIP